jgi:hypothetical protein
MLRTINSIIMRSNLLFVTIVWTLRLQVEEGTYKDSKSGFAETIIFYMSIQDKCWSDNP